MPHRRVFSVERRPFYDGVPGATLRACDEGVEVSPVHRIQQLAQTIRAYGEVGRNRRKGILVRLAFPDQEPLSIFLGDDVHFSDRLQPGCPGERGMKLGEKRRHHPLTALDFCDHLGPPVLDVTAQAKPNGNTVDRGTKTDALNRSHEDKSPAQHRPRIPGSPRIDHSRISVYCVAGGRHGESDSQSARS